MFANTFLLLFSFLMIYYVFMLFYPVMVVFFRFKNRNKKPKITERFKELPLVTIQVPIYNEKGVAKRTLLSIAELDYPKDKLHIQALDDSTDEETSQIIKNSINELKQQGFDVEYITRKDRMGYKAGNLKNALPNAKGEFVAVFDADVVVPKSFFNEAIHYFTEANVCFVQARLGTINRNQNFFTKLIANLTDADHAVSQAGLNWGGHFITFNGTGGIWRKQAIFDVGGWSLDTLGEDRDLSYRCYLKGWKGIYLSDISVPTEVPPDMNTFKIQRFRWGQGTAECNKKFFKEVLHSDLNFSKKTVILFSMVTQFLTPVWFLTTLMLLAFILFVDYGLFPQEWNSLKIPFFTIYFVVTYGTLFAFLSSGQICIRKNWSVSEVLLHTFILPGLQLGMFLPALKAIFDGIFEKETEFVTTPKTGSSDHTDHAVADSFDDATSDSGSYFQTGAWVFGLVLLLLTVALIYKPYSLYVLPVLLINGIVTIYVMED